VPQTPEPNRGAWEGVESAVRRLAERKGALYVVTGPVFQGSNLRTLHGRVLVADATSKAVYDPRVGGAAAYVCDNTTRPACTPISITRLAAMTGIDPLPVVSDPVKQRPIALPPPEESPYAHHARQRRHAPGLLEWLLRLVGVHDQARAI
jgi:endonuclease G